MKRLASKERDFEKSMPSNEVTQKDRLSKHICINLVWRMAERNTKINYTQTITVGQSLLMLLNVYKEDANGGVSLS